MEFDFVDTVDKAILENSHRFEAWTLCHQQFVKKRNELKSRAERRLTEEEIESLSLHLTAYLASWGMYARDSYLENNNYTIHENVVPFLLSEEYDAFENLDILAPDCLQRIQKMPISLFSRSRKVPTVFGCYPAIVVSREKMQEKCLSTIALSKIILGVLGSVPAFDRFVIAYLRFVADDWGIPVSGTYSQKTVQAIAEYFGKNYRQEISEIMLKYPYLQLTHMRVIDIYLWEKGKMLLDNN